MTGRLKRRAPRWAVGMAIVLLSALLPGTFASSPWSRSVPSGAGLRSDGGPLPSQLGSHTYVLPGATEGRPVGVDIEISTTCPGPDYFCTMLVTVAFGDGQFDTAWVSSDYQNYFFAFGHVYPAAASYPLTWNATLIHYWNGSYANQSYSGSALVAVQSAAAPNWTPIVASGVFVVLVAVASGYLLLPPKRPPEISARQFVEGEAAPSGRPR